MKKKPRFEVLLATGIFFCLAGIVLFSGFKKPSASVHQDYIKYSTYVYKAETNILDSAYNDALTNYSKAFTYTNKPLAKHCFTALQVAAQQNSIDLFKRFTTLGMQRGLKPQYFTEDSLLNTYVKSKQLTRYIQKQFDMYHKDYEQSLNKFLNDTLTKISVEDMKWKHPYLDSLPQVDPENTELYHHIYDSIIKVIVEQKLFPVIEKYGYPGERLLGFYKNGSDYRYSLGNAQAKVTLMHYYSFPRECSYNNLLMREVEKGNLVPSQFATIIEFQARFSNSECSKSTIYYENYFDNDSTQFNAINERRIKIGLDSFEDHRRKYKRGQKACKEIKKGNYKNIKLFYWCG